MIRINLLPYRKERRQKQIIQHLSYVGAVLACVLLLVVGLNMYITGVLSDMQEEKAQLQRQNAQLAKKIGKLRGLDKLREDVEGKLALVDRLQEGRFETLMTLNGIAEAIPENVWFSSVVDNHGQLKFVGYAESNKAVANFMRALDQSNMFQHIALQMIKRVTVAGMPVRSFTLSLRRVIEKKTVKGKQS